MTEPTEKAYMIPRSDVCMADAMQFNQHFEVRIPVPIKSIPDIGLALQSAASIMRSGDQVTVCAFEDKSWRALTEVATYRVAGAGRALRLFRVFGPVLVPKEMREEAKAVANILSVKPLGSGFVVVDAYDNQIEQFAEEGQAQAFARRENAKHPAATADAA